MSTLRVEGIKNAAASSDAITLATDGTCTAKITNNLSNRRLNYNGAMTVAQRGTSVSVGTDGEYFSPDRWKFNRSNSGDYTISQDAESPAGFANSLKVACTGTATVTGTNRETGIYYCFEGQDLQHLEKGTSSSKKLVLSWWFKTNKTGTYTVELMDTDNSFRHVGKEITVSDTNWNKYTWSIPADTTGVLDDDANKSMQMGLWLMSSGQYRGGTMQTAWGALAQANRAPNQVNFADSTSNVCYFSGIQLEVDNGSGIPTDFEHRSYGEELARCQRYYNEVANTRDQGGQDCTLGMFAQVYDGNGAHIIGQFNPPMRAVPNLQTTQSSGSYLIIVGNNSATFNELIENSKNRWTNHSFELWTQGGLSGLTAGHAAFIRLRKEVATTVVAFSAEL